MNRKPNPHCKARNGWTLCPSKRFPGMFFYFNVHTGETEWFTEVEKRREPVPQKYPSYPEPKSPPIGYMPIPPAHPVYHPPKPSYPFMEIAGYPNNLFFKYPQNFMPPRVPVSFHSPPSVASGQTFTVENKKKLDQDTQTSELNFTVHTTSRKMTHRFTKFIYERKLGEKFTYESIYDENEVPAKKLRADAEADAVKITKNCSMYTQAQDFNSKSTIKSLEGTNEDATQETMEKQGEEQEKSALKDQTNKNVQSKTTAKLEENDLRFLLLSKRRKDENKQVNIKVPAKTGESIPKQKKVTFDIESVCGDNTHNVKDEDQTASLPININNLKELCFQELDDNIWYIVTDANTLIDEFQFISNLIEADSNCRLQLPQQVKTSLLSVATGDSRGRSRVAAARQAVRKITEWRANGKVQEEVIPNSNANRDKYADILECCLNVMENNPYLIIISDDGELLRVAKEQVVDHYTVAEIKTLVTTQQKIVAFDIDVTKKNTIQQNIDPFDTKQFKIVVKNDKIFINNDKISNNNDLGTENKNGGAKTEFFCPTVPRRQSVDVYRTVDENETNINEYTKEIHNHMYVPHIGDRIVRDIHKQSPYILKNNSKNMSFKDTIPSHDICKLTSPNDADVIYRGGSVSPTLLRNEQNQYIYDEKVYNGDENLYNLDGTQYTCDEKQYTFDEKQFTSDDDHYNNEENMYPEHENFTSKYFKRNPKNDVAYDIQDKMKRFFLKDPNAIKRLKSRMEEIVITFVQIIEDSLHNVLLGTECSTMKYAERPPPWTMHEAIQWVTKMFPEERAVALISGKMANLLGSNGTIGPNIKPGDFMTIFGYAYLLLEYLNELPENSTILEEPLSNLQLVLSEITEDVNMASRDDDIAFFDAMFTDVELDEGRQEVRRNKSEVVLEYLMRHFPRLHTYANPDDSGNNNRKEITEGHKTENIIDSECKIVRTVGRNLKNLKLHNTGKFTIEKTIQEINNELFDKGHQFIDNTDSNPTKVVRNVNIIQKYEDLFKKKSDVRELEKSDSTPLREEVTRDVTAVRDELTSDSGIVNSEDSVHAQGVAKMFLSQIKCSMLNVYNFIDTSVKKLEDGINKSQKMRLNKKTQIAQEHVKKIIEVLKGIIDRESTESPVTLRKLLIKTSTECRDIQLSRYTQVITKCLEQADSFDRALKLMNSLTIKIIDPKLLQTDGSIKYYNIFEK